MVAVSEPMFGVLVILEGIFNGVGDTVKPFYYALFSMWGVRVFLTFLCVHVFHLGLYAVWGCMIANNVGVGDTVKPFYYALFSMWGVRVFLTFLCVHVFHLGLYAVWGCMIANNVCLGSLFIIRYFRGEWNPLRKEIS